MKRKSLPIFFLLAIIGTGLAGCHSDVDLSKVEVDSNVRVRASLPLGEITTSFGNLIGLINNQSNIRVNKDSIFELFYDQTYPNREYHAIDLTKYIGATNSTTLLKDVMDPLPPYMPANTEMTVPFDMVIAFDGVNNDVNSERLDSMVIEKARFTTKIQTEDFDITDADIEKVVMKLGQQFRRAKGRDIELPNFHLGQDVAIELDEFTLVMMDDLTKDPGFDNVVQNADMTFEVVLKPVNDVQVKSTSGLAFNFKVEMMEYKALFGYFKAGDMANDSDVIDVPLKLPGGEPMILPIKKPEIQLLFTYGLGMPLSVELDYLRAIDSKGNYNYATWNGQPNVKLNLPNFVGLTDPYDASVTDTIRIDYQDENGNIDELFKHEIQKLGYKYKVFADTNRIVNGKKMNQYRMTQNTKYSLELHMQAPLDFDKGLRIVYLDTIRDVNLSTFQLDSLAASVTGGIISDVKKAELYMYLTVNNNIPVGFTIDGVLLDENGKEISEVDSFKDRQIKSALYNPDGTITPSNYVDTIKIVTEQFEQVAKAKEIKIRARVGDDNQPSVFTTNDKLSIKMGVTADLEGLLNFQFNK